MGDEACMMRHVCLRCGRVHDAHDPAAQCREPGDSTGHSQRTDGSRSDSSEGEAAEQP